MALNLKDPAAERLAAEVASLTGESKTRAIRVALQERRDRLAGMNARAQSAERLRRFLDDEVWPLLPRNARGKGVSRAEREAILGYGPGGV